MKQCLAMFKYWIENLNRKLGKHKRYPADQLSSGKMLVSKRQSWVSNFQTTN